ARRNQRKWAIPLKLSPPMDRFTCGVFCTLRTQCRFMLAMPMWSCRHLNELDRDFVGLRLAAIVRSRLWSVCRGHFTLTSELREHAALREALPYRQGHL